MKRSIPFGLLAIGLVVGGCAAPADDTASAADTSASAYSSGTWQQLLGCNDGAAVLDVDTGERRNVQFVIRDKNVVDYLQSKGISPMVNAKHEIVIQPNEQLKHGLFSPSDFGADDFWSYRVPDFVYAAIVQREGKGIKVTLAKQFEPICDGGSWGYQGGCIGGHTIRARVIEEAANWYFDDCH